MDVGDCTTAHVNCSHVAGGDMSSENDAQSAASMN